MGTKTNAKVNTKVTNIEKLLAQKEDGEILRIPVVLSIVEINEPKDWGKVKLLKEWVVKLHFGDGHGEVDEISGFKLKAFASKRKPGTWFEKFEVPTTTYTKKGSDKESTITFVRNTTEALSQDGRMTRLMSNIVKTIMATIQDTKELVELPTGTAEDDDLAS